MLQSNSNLLNVLPSSLARSTGRHRGTRPSRGRGRCTSWTPGLIAEGLSSDLLGGQQAATRAHKEIC